MFIKYKKSNISATTRIHDITRETNEHLNLWSCVLFRLFWAHRPHHFSLNQCCLPHLHPRSGSVASKSFYSLFQSSAGVGEPGGHLSEGHLGDDGQHDFFSFRGVGVFPVFAEPGLQGGGGISCGVLPVSGSPNGYGPRGPAYG